MDVTFVCPNCGRTARCRFSEQSANVRCHDCGQEIAKPADAVVGNQLQRCLICPSDDLYVRKDFPQRLGVALVGIGIVGSSVAWAYTSLFWTFAILFATALADLVLFLIVGSALMCYRCSAVYRGVEQMDVHGQFDLETHERYRQMAARLGE